MVGFSIGRAVGGRRGRWVVRSDRLWLVGRSVAQSLGRSVGRSVGLSAGKSADQTVIGWLVGLPCAQSVR